MENYFTAKNIVPQLEAIAKNPGMYYLGHLGERPEILHVEVTGSKGDDGCTILTGRFGRECGGISFSCFHESYPFYVIGATLREAQYQMKDALSFRVDNNAAAVKANLEAKNKWLKMRSSIDTLGVSKGWTVKAGTKLTSAFPDGIEYDGMTGQVVNKRRGE